MGTGRRKDREPEKNPYEKTTEEIPKLEKLIPIGDDDDFNPVILKANEATQQRNQGARAEAAKRLRKGGGGN